MGIMRQQDSAEKIAEHEVLRDLVPLNALSRGHFEELLDKFVVESEEAGSYLFGVGDRDNRSIYLLDGEVRLIDKYGKVTGVIHADTEPARYPLANLQPRYVSARVTKKSVIAHIDSNLLDSLLTRDQCADSEPGKVAVETRDDWLERFLQSEAFVKLEPAAIQRLCKALKPVTMRAGDVVFEQGDDADYLYILREGRCIVSYCVSSEGLDVPLSELEVGHFFGEESLAADARCNATATMLTDGKLMRLSRFESMELLRKPLIQFVDYELAASMVENGGTWLDVRLTDEHDNYTFKGSINIPLLYLREKMQELDISRRYVICCNTGMRSTSAAFLLSHAGFDVHVLTNGMHNGVPAEVLGLVDDSIEVDEPVDTGLEWDSGSAHAPAAGVEGEGESEQLQTLKQERDDAIHEAREAKQALARMQETLAALRAGKK